MMDYLVICGNNLPSIAMEALSLAHEYESRHVAEHEYSGINENLWLFLRQNGMEYDFTSWPSRAARAAICVLDVGRGNDLDDAAYWFFEFVYDPERDDLLREEFGKVFGGNVSAAHWPTGG